jgi:hypothetical protein
MTASNVIEDLGAQVAESVTQNIFPMRLIKYDDPARLVINQGGITVKVGQEFRAVRLGVDLYDPHTHELLGQEEIDIARVAITSVTPKLSYARLLSGELAAGGGAIVLRRVDANAVVVPPQATPPIIKLPFD